MRKPGGKRKVGRPKIAWKRTVEKERVQEGWSNWAKAVDTAQERTDWTKGKGVQGYTAPNVERTNHE